MKLNQLHWEESPVEKRKDTCEGVFKTNRLRYSIVRKKYAKETSIEVTITTASGTIYDTFHCDNVFDLEIYLNEKENEEPELDIDIEEE